MGLTWAHSSKKRGRDGQGRQFKGKVIHLGADKAEGDDTANENRRDREQQPGGS